MKITSEKFEISPSDSVFWRDVKTIRILNDKLAFVLNDDRVVELSHLRPSTVDMAFRAYEKYLRDQ